MSMTPRTLPIPASLDEAVDLVVKHNLEDGYPPNRFKIMVTGKHGLELLRICEHLVTNAATLAHIDKAFVKHPQLLTIEDFIARFGAEWGLSKLAIEQAEANCVYFDQLAGGKRYA